MKERRRYVRKYGGEVEVARGMRKSISKEVRVSKRFKAFHKISVK